MILLDTNIISELMKNSPSANVLAWINSQETADLYITTITIAEIYYGLNALHAGKRRHALEIAFNKAITHAFKQRILSFDTTAAEAYGQLMAHGKQTGRPNCSDCPCK